MAQSVGQPTLTALAATILIRRRDYYEQLEAANKQNEITPWLSWFAGTALEAQQRTQAQIAFVVAKVRLLNRLRGELNTRQEKVLLRMLDEGPGGFTGGLSAANYVAITRTSPATARRDLGNLVEIGALDRTGERKSTRYHLPIALMLIRAVTIAEDGAIVVR